MTKNQDLLAGGLFVLIGVIASISSLGYEMGTVRRMGPGYFPLMLGLLLVGLGLAMVVEARRRAKVVPVDWGTIRPLVFVLGGLAFFGLALPTLGFVLANMLFVGITTYAGREFRLIESIVLALVLTLMATLIFIFGLNLQMPLWPAFLGL